MNKYERAVALLQDHALSTLSESLCCVTKDSPRWVRFTYRTFTLDVRLESDQPALVAPYYLADDALRALVLDALEGAVREVSDGEVGLVELTRSLPVVPYGVDVLRCLMPLRVVQGGRLEPGRSACPPPLRVA